MWLRWEVPHSLSEELGLVLSEAEAVVPGRTGMCEVSVRCGD